MKKALLILLSLLMVATVLPITGAAADEVVSAPSGFAAEPALYAHAVSGSGDTEAWQAWQSVHDEDFVVANPSEKFFFLPSSADKSTVDVYNNYDAAVTVNGVQIPSKSTAAVPYAAGTAYRVTAGGASYTLTMMNSNAEAAIYINNPDADGNGTDLMTYLNSDKSLSAAATGAIVTPDGKVDNTPIKKIKGRGNTSWSKPKKGYNINYDKKVSIAGMEKNKKYSILANYQDDSLSRNRILYDLSDAVGLPYASDSRFVDFYVNGFYWGSYQMAEKVEPGSLVPEVTDDGYLNEDGTVKEDFPFIAEVDASAGDGDYYVSTNGMKVTIKAPEIDPGEVGYEEVKNYVKAKFSAFYNATTPSGDLAAVADIDSVAKLYLINELGKNWDCGVSSTFFTYKQDENGVYKFYGSPVWDYDNSLGNATGVKGDLNSFGVTDYEAYTGWWCRNKGKTGKRSSNIMARISLNNQVTAATPAIWFEDFVPAIEHFTGRSYSEDINTELMTRDAYLKYITESAAMNYGSGWLLNTGSWIADHSRLNKAAFDPETKKMVVSSTATRYYQNFGDMYAYACDWMDSRSAWLSEQFAPDYIPATLIGDTDNDGEIGITDVTMIQRHIAGFDVPVTEEELLLRGDVDFDEEAGILDATLIQRYLAEIPSSNSHVGEYIRK